MDETGQQEARRLLSEAIRRMLLCRMPDQMRAAIQALLAKPDVTVYELKSAHAHYVKRLVLKQPREEIGWNPAVDAERCTGCGVCFSFCPHGVFEMRDDIAVVAHPTECVILCSNCMPRCPSQAISFPPQKEYVELLQYE
jgi:NAD-dependent dihydropyrimidine dehydrogenase PreA subunit